MSVLHEIALTLIPGVGHATGKKLLVACDGAQAVFEESRRALVKIDGIGEAIVNQLFTFRDQALERAAAEVEFVNKYKIRTLFYTQSDYPKRLRECVDSPIMIYYRGTADLNVPKVVAIVGTRKSTDYGRDVCRAITESLSSVTPLIISGLAYGIDSCAHKSALDFGLQTVGVLAHGLDRLYPSSNKGLAQRMLGQGGLLTDYMSQTIPDRENFPTRNRIIAGLADAVVVVEGSLRGGALITAEIANSYNRDVFSVPGRIGDEYSEGCNYLIKTNRAHLIQGADDIKYIMGWSDESKPKVQQQKLMVVLSADEEALVNILQSNDEASIDKLCSMSGLTPTKAASALLSLEFQGLIRCLPGKMYKLK